MPGRIFVGNISYNASDEDLSELVAGLNIQAVSVKIMRETETGRSRGFGFVELAPETDLDAAIQMLNGKVLDGRTLTANEARPPKKRDFGPPPGQGFSQDRGRFSGRRGSRERDRDRPKRKFQELY